MGEDTYRSRSQIDGDGYNIHNIEFTVPSNTTDLHVYFVIEGVATSSEPWAAAELWFEVNGQRRDTIYKNSTDGDKNWFEHYRFQAETSGFYPSVYYNQTINFRLREKNRHADVTNFDFYVTRKY